MKLLFAFATTIFSATICAAMFMLVSEFAVLPIFYATSLEGTVAWAAIYVAGPAGLISGAALGLWLVLGGISDNNPPKQSAVNEDFVHE